MNADTLVDELFTQVAREALVKALQQPDTHALYDKIIEVAQGNAGLAITAALARVLNDTLHSAPDLIRPSLRSVVGDLLAKPDFDEVKSQEPQERQEEEEEETFDGRQQGTWPQEESPDAEYFRHNGNVYVRPVSNKAHDYFNSKRFGESPQFLGTYGFAGYDLPGKEFNFVFVKVPAPVPQTQPAA